MTAVCHCRVKKADACCSRSRLEPPVYERTHAAAGRCDRKVSSYRRHIRPRGFGGSVNERKVYVMQRLSISIILAVGILMFALSGCAGREKPATTADIMRGYAADVQAEVELKEQLAKDWERGSELAQTGRERIRDGQEMIQEGNSQINQGKREVTQGTQLMQDSERRFRENFPGLQLRPGGGAGGTTGQTSATE